MKKQENRRVKVLVSIVSQADEAKLTEVINGYATAMHFSGIGHGTARSHHRSYFGLDDAWRAIIEKRRGRSHLYKSKKWFRGSKKSYYCQDCKTHFKE